MIKYAPLLAAAILTTGCASRIAESLDTRQNAGPCPPVAALYDSARYVEFDGEGKLYTNIEYTGEIIGARLYCRYVGDNPLEAEIEVDFAFGKGPAATSDDHVYPYYVAVTRRNGKVLAKKYFSVSADFNGGKLDGKTEVVNKIKIPRVDESISGSNFEVIVGYDLTPEQLEFNRAGNRFRLDAGQ
ncbi:hypothetical protein [Hyphomonas pacifica]|uniref:Lipoprotein n=1 Tax=Hyphomonas pacifica TaxID=1280941 RepID=A0A062U9M6_9PROT|nr:hypothetical protein [Hyphomonas pacifica]KCZ52845.1 hypothetical protein HY2_06870 [Hyphomonas pacifica]RAN35309.1 hypothetical protein HY3_08400 [Hyphomonas pacifica]RAN38299.1 hypothetical protein HY11_00370 [Hyphomonas pacifica]